MVDVSDAPTPAAAVVTVLDLVFGPADPDYYGQLIRYRELVPWKPAP
jgi:hypothetical protein